MIRAFAKALAMQPSEKKNLTEAALFLCPEGSIEERCSWRIYNLQPGSAAAVCDKHGSALHLADPVFGRGADMMAQWSDEDPDGNRPMRISFEEPPTAAE